MNFCEYIDLIIVSLKSERISSSIWESLRLMVSSPASASKKHAKNLVWVYSTKSLVSSSPILRVYTLINHLSLFRIWKNGISFANLSEFLLCFFLTNYYDVLPWLVRQIIYVCLDAIKGRVFCMISWSQHQ